MAVNFDHVEFRMKYTLIFAISSFIHYIIYEIPLCIVIEKWGVQKEYIIRVHANKLCRIKIIQVQLLLSLFLWNKRKIIRQTKNMRILCVHSQVKIQTKNITKSVTVTNIGEVICTTRRTNFWSLWTKKR